MQMLNAALPSLLVIPNWECCGLWREERPCRGLCTDAPRGNASGTELLSPSVGSAPRWSEAGHEAELGEERLGSSPGEGLGVLGAAAQQEPWPGGQVASWGHRHRTGQGLAVLSSGQPHPESSRVRDGERA